jgi:hypothetical protein
MVLATLVTRTVLSVGQQQVDVVAANEVLSQIDNGCSQTRFSVVILSLL